MKRIFLAIPVGENEEVAGHLEKLRKALSDEKIKWVKPEKLHLTLHFFGDTEEKDIERVDKLFENYLAGLPAFDLHFAGAGVFPGLRKPRVLWFDIEPSERMDGLAEAVTDVLIEGDFALPDKPFSPHLTIGRIKRINDQSRFRNVLNDFRDRDIASIEVREVHFIESLLTPVGPVYKTMKKYMLRE